MPSINPTTFIIAAAAHGKKLWGLAGLKPVTVSRANAVPPEIQVVELPICPSRFWLSMDFVHIKTGYLYLSNDHELSVYLSIHQSCYLFKTFLTYPTYLVYLVHLQQVNA